MHWSTLAVCALVILTSPGTGEAAQSHKWWQSAEIRNELHLSDEASAHIEQIFQATLPELRSGWHELNDLEQELDTLINQREVAEADVIAEIDRVEGARCRLRKTRTLMLFRMHRVLTAEQRAKLKALDDRHRGGRSSRDRDDRRR